MMETTMPRGLIVRMEFLVDAGDQVEACREAYCTVTAALDAGGWGRMVGARMAEGEAWGAEPQG
jgi:hypothetical protein